MSRAILILAIASGLGAATEGTQTVSLDGRGWRLAADPNDAGWRAQWWRAPQPGSVPTRVPWAMQYSLPGYHGVAWYWRDFTGPVNPHPHGRTLLRFWAVNYKGDIWLNDKYLGGREGGELPFTFDVTGLIRPGKPNRLAARVLDPSYDVVIDGTSRYEAPRRGGPALQHGGIEDSVELLLAPAARIADLYVKPDPVSGKAGIEATIMNGADTPLSGNLILTITQDRRTEVLASGTVPVFLKPGESLVTAGLQVANPLLWDLDRPNLYRVTARLSTAAPAASEDRYECRFGFRDFRFERGAFRLNGKRVLIQAAPVSNFDPVGFWLPFDHGASPDVFQRRLIHAKEMGFNMIRVHRGAARRNMLEMADELGVMIYEECFASSRFNPSPYMADRFRSSFRDLVLRDRNHPSIVVWGVLNEIRADWEQFQEGVGALPLIRSLDRTRMAMLNSGRWDNLPHIGSISNPGSFEWRQYLGNERPDAPTVRSVVQASKEGENAHAAEMGDIHYYVGMPFTEQSRKIFRTLGAGAANPVFLSEFGVGSGIDLEALWEFYRKQEATHLEPAQFTKRMLDLFLSDWREYRLGDIFGSPKEFFRQTLARGARNRLELINAVRSNPRMAGFSNVSMSERPMLAQGMMTMYGELKPGMKEAMRDALAPARFCLFADPGSCYAGQKVRLEAVLANADALPPGEYKALVQLTDASGAVTFTKEVPVRIEPGEPPLAQSVFSEDVPVSGKGGAHRFTVRLPGVPEIAGGQTELYVFDRREMPAVRHEVVLWGSHAGLESWLTANGVRWRRFDEATSGRELIVAVESAPAPGGKAAFDVLLDRVARGSAAVFLSEKVFKEGRDATRWLPLDRKGTILRTQNWLLLKDEWIRDHPVFEGLQRGGVVDYPFYRNLLHSYQPIFAKIEPPETAIAGSISTSSFQADLGVYYSGLMVAEYRFGAGRFLLNTMQVLANLGTHPQAERLLRNILNHVGAGAEGPLAALPAGFDRGLAGLYQSGGGVRPEIDIITPHDGARLAGPATVSITVRAAQLDRKIRKVEFYAGGTKIGEDTKREPDLTPFAFIWSAVPRGSYKLTAKAVDEVGETSESAPVSIRVE